MADRSPPHKPTFPSESEIEEAATEELQVIADEDDRREQILNRLLDLTFDDFNRRSKFIDDISFPRFASDYLHQLYDAITSRVYGINLTAPTGTGGAFSDDPLDIDEMFSGERAVMLQSFIDEFRRELATYHSRRLSGDPVPINIHAFAGDQGEQAVSTEAPGIGYYQEEDHIIEEVGDSEDC